MITHLEPDIQEFEVKWALESITINKASGDDGILAELFWILKGDAVKVLHLICQQIWKTQQKNNNNKNPCPHAAYILISNEGQGDQKKKNQINLKVYI